MKDSSNNAPATKQDLEELGQNLRQEMERVIETMRDIETNMLRDFHGYARGQQARLHDVGPASTQ
jgi:hypothetical protein